MVCTLGGMLNSSMGRALAAALVVDASAHAMNSGVARTVLAPPAEGEWAA